MTVWNKAAITKLLWDLASKKDCLWIKWLQCYYIKQYDVSSIPLPKNASWIVRKILDCRDAVMENQQLQGNLFSRLKSLCKLDKFQIQKLYLTMLPNYSKVDWRNVMLTVNVQPRHKFTVWLAAQHRLPTIDRLKKFGVDIPVECAFCKQQEEMFEHLFFACTVTNRLWLRICYWMGYNRVVSTWENELKWICSKARSRNWHKALTATAFVTTVALIWRARNSIRFDSKIFAEDQFCKEVALLIHTRSRKCKRWHEGLSQLHSYP